MIDEQANQCLLDSQQACLEVRETLLGSAQTNKNCKSNAQDMKTAVGTCTGYATADLTDTKLGKMKAKATAGAVAKAMTTAKEGGCDGGHATDAYKSCVETAVGEACKAAKGTECSQKTIELQRSQGAAKSMAMTVTACVEAGTSDCTEVKKKAYLATTGKSTLA